MSKKVLWILFLLLYGFQNTLIGDAIADSVLKRVVNETLYSLYVNSNEIMPRGTFDPDLSIPKPPNKGIEFKGIGYNEIPFKTGQIIALQPLDSIGFAWLDEQFAKGQVTVVFQAKSDKGDIQVVFGKGIAKDYTYKVVIGANNNTESLIAKQDAVKSRVTRDENPDAMAGILETQEAEAYPQYWICYNNGLIVVGKGVPGDNIFLSWRDPEYDRFVARVGFSSNKEEIRYTNIQLLPALVTVPPMSVYETLSPIVTKPKKVEIKQQDDFIRYGGVVKIKNAGTTKDLQVMPATTRVVCSNNVAWESYWIIKGPHATDEVYKIGDPIRSGSVVRLECVNSRKNLNYKEQVNVSGQDGVGEKSNDWNVKVLSDQKGKFWQLGDQINLVSLTAKQNLSCKKTAPEKAANVIISKDVGPDSLWKIEDYHPPLTREILPTGSVITLKNKLNNKYLEELKRSYKNTVAFGQVIKLANKQEIPASGTADVPTTVKNFLATKPNNKFETNSNPPGAFGNWAVLNYRDVNSTNPIKFGGVVVLRSALGKYLSSTGEGISEPNNDSFWTILDANNPLSRDELKKDDEIALKSISQGKYLSGNKKNQVVLKNYIGGDESWMIGIEGKKDIEAPLIYAEALDTDALRTRFKVIRSGDGWIGLQSFSSGKNVEARKQDWVVSVDGENFYKDNSSQEQFLIRKVKDDYFVLSKETNGTLNLNGTPNKGSQIIKTNNKNKPAGYEDSAKLELEILSVPEIKVLQATYGSVASPDKAFEVSDIVQSRVLGSELIIPAGKLEKNKLFGNPAPGLEKQLVIMYEKGGERLTETVNDQEALLLGVKENFAKTNVLNVLSMNGEYEWLDYVLRIPGRGSVVFDVKTAGDVYVAFAKQAGDAFGSEEPLYEVVVGADDGTKTILHRKSHEKQMVYSSTPNIVSDDGKFHRFWLSINGGIILFGKGNLGENLLLAYKDKNPLLLLERIGLASGDKPLICQNIKIAPPVNLEIPFNMLEEYKQKLQTTIESTRLLKVVCPFTYTVYHEGPQVRLKDKVGRDKSIGVTEMPGMKAYPFSLEFDRTGDPYLILEYGPKMGDVQKGMRMASAGLSGVSETLSGIAPMMMMGGGGGKAGAAIMGASLALSAGSKIMETGLDQAYSPVENVRSEQYRQQLLSTYSDPDVQRNDQVIAQRLAAIT